MAPIARSAEETAERFNDLRGVPRGRGRPRLEVPTPRVIIQRRAVAMRELRDRFHNRALTCECGTPKTRDQRACDRCTFLDEPMGMRSALAIIRALRNERYLTIIELAEEIGQSTRQTLRTVKQLVELCRIESVVEDCHEPMTGGFREYWAKRGDAEPSKWRTAPPSTFVYTRNLWHLTDRGASNNPRGIMTKKNSAPKMFRQGDVLIVAIDSIPSDAKELPRTKRGIILAEGEVTGHAHRIPSRHATLMRTESDARYMRVTAPVALNHEEHTTVDIPKGDYRVTIHAEYVPGELPRQVQD